MPILLQLQKLPWKGDGGWEKKYAASFLGWPEDREFVGKKKCVLGHLIARATSYCLFPDTLWLRASKNAFKVGSVKFANSLSLPSIVKQVRTGSKSSQGTWAMLGKSWGSQQPCLNCPIESTGKEENWTVPSIQVTRYISCLCEKLGNVVHLILNSSWRVQSLNELWIGIVYLQLKKNKKTCW